MNLKKIVAVTGTAVLLTALGAAAVFASPASLPRTNPTEITTSTPADQPAANQEGTQVEDAAGDKDDKNVEDKNGPDDKDLGQSGANETGQTGQNEGDHSD